MREIKFRAWDGEKMNYEVDMLSKWGAIKKGYSSTPWIEEASAGFSMQYTGLKDKNGKEIYEGHIITIKNNYYNPSKGDSPTLLLEVKQEAGAYVIGDYLLREFESSEMEIVGDIHENPELLK